MKNDEKNENSELNENNKEKETIQKKEKNVIQIEKDDDIIEEDII